MQTLEYALKISTVARRLRIAVHRDGRCIVTVPQKMNRAIAERFVAKKTQWILQKQEFFKQRQGVSIVKSNIREYKKYKQQALGIIKKNIEKFNAIYQLSFTRVCIRNQESRWGSCSRRGNLNFNIRIALIPERLAEYIVAHELCHLQELNHSRAFWDLVSRTVPDYALRRRELKKIFIG